MRHGLSELLCVALLTLATSAFAQQIRGDYVETRSADVYTGQCFANGEVNLVGDEAILAWHVTSGSWSGVTLDGFTVAAAVKARATLGDPYANPYPARVVMIVDEQASPQQQQALIAFAQQMGGELLRNVEQVIPATMELAVSAQSHGVARLRAGRLAPSASSGLSVEATTCGVTAV